MTKEQILEKVRGLAKGNRIVEVHILDKANGERDVEDANSIQRKLNELLESEEVLGAIYYSGYEEPGREEFTTDPRGVDEFQIAFNKVVDRQSALREAAAANSSEQKKGQ